MDIEMLDPKLLQTFVAVAESGSFTGAARRLGVSQPTVSHHINRLEGDTGRQLVDRDTRNLRLTEHGDVLVGQARTILAAHKTAEDYLSGTEVTGRLRFGTVEDLAITQLPRILQRFRQHNPEVDLELTVDQSIPLARRLRTGQLDLILVKGNPDEPEAGIPVGHDRFVWVGQDTTTWAAGSPVPLIANRAPSVSRRISVRALDEAGLPWRITCGTKQVNGTLAAVRAGLGVTIFPHSLVPPDLALVGERLGLPELSDVEFTLLTNPLAAKEPTDALIAAIRSEALRTPR